MTIRRDAGAIVFVCDVATGSRCDGELATQQSDFGAALEVLRACQWRCYKFNLSNKFGHSCPRCPKAR